MTPLTLPSDAQIEKFGTIYGLLKPFALVSPSSLRTILDVGSVITRGADSYNTVGIVYEVFGPVASPLYSVLVRENDFCDLTVGQDLFCSVQHSTIVSKEALVSEKGIDNDLDEGDYYSDDEEERRHKAGLEVGQL